MFGFDHQDVGAEAMESWGIPESIVLPIKHHHNSADCPGELHKQAEALALADMISSFYHGGSERSHFGRLRDHISEKLNMPGDEAVVFIDSVALRTIELLSFYEIDAGEMMPVSELLQLANKELGNMTLSYEQMIVELKVAKQEAEKLAVELWGAKEQMREIAVRDVLTGLFNHRHFHDIMDKELQRGERFHHCLSLIILDIDHFKKVNDTYGHLKGDEVLRSVGNVIGQFVRVPDTAARYGGEEFAVILPETGLEGAVSMAERIRELVSELSMKCEDSTIEVTISVGVTTYEPSRGLKKKAAIIHAADRALYNSKATGRNKLSIAPLH